ncbi:phosphoglycerate dehydrogenase [Variovorax sp. J31P207]|uniref:phosphoglycerate dehydrogenase n=1 Tax=Variovorax sp. J31P207 TaxID=3053510 RepID=UPI002576270B|nr:phosphoglycerate dehydrogenase [Variovorax sp. J31P207]MDM0072127.1 phosphoglycerate dehydrogenase [Variovorax sp. J31P207]
MASKDVLVTARFFDDDAKQLLRDHGLRVVTADVPYDGVDSVISPAMHVALESAVAWVIGIAPVTRELLDRYPRMVALARRGVGYDTIDVDAVRSARRLLTNTPGGNEPSVADHAIGLMLGVAKRLVESHERARAGNWTVLVGTELYGKTVGLVGLGRIARQIVKRLKGFDVRVLAFDVTRDGAYAAEAGVEYVTLEELLTRSDIVSLHAPLTAQTRHLLDEPAITRMKRGAIVINTARGELIDDAALLSALQSGQLGGAGLDVVGSERDPALLPITEKLLSLPNVLCTPHAAGSSREGLARSNLLAAQCVIAAIEGRAVPAQCIVADGRSH